MNKSGSIWQAKREGEEEEETEEQQAARTAEFLLGVKRQDAVYDLRIAADAAERAFGKFQETFPALTDLMEHQGGVEDSTRMVERVAFPLRQVMRDVRAEVSARQVMAGPLVPRVAAMSRGAGEGHADISVEEGGGDSDHQKECGGGLEASVREDVGGGGRKHLAGVMGSKRGGVAKAGRAKLVLCVKRRDHCRSWNCWSIRGEWRSPRGC